ncbi:MAG: hypothetical protein QOG52_1617, partial [Frankiaceae bacterium]|nr:hypothetical protein [Frankiaceae bacterium]
MLNLPPHKTSGGKVSKFRTVRHSAALTGILA